MRVPTRGIILSIRRPWVRWMEKVLESAPLPPTPPLEAETFLAEAKALKEVFYSIVWNAPRY